MAQQAADERSAAKNKIVAKAQLLQALISDERTFAQLDASKALEALRRSEQKLGDALALSGDSSRVRQQIEAGLSARTIYYSWQEGHDRFARERTPFLLY